LHQRALVIAMLHFQDIPAYVRGDMAMIDELAANFALYSALLDLPELERALTQSQANEMLHGFIGKR
jgi:hypothetical protein